MIIQLHSLAWKQLPEASRFVGLVICILALVAHLYLGIGWSANPAAWLVIGVSEVSQSYDYFKWAVLECAGTSLQGGHLLLILGLLIIHFINCCNSDNDDDDDDDGLCRWLFNWAVLGLVLGARGGMRTLPYHSPTITLGLTPLVCQNKQSLHLFIINNCSIFL